MNYSDIPQFTPSGHYSVNVGWPFVEKNIILFDETCGGRLYMNPEFQRAHVWTEEQQRRYVEFCLRGGRSSRDIYWNCSNWARGGSECPMYLVDGKQRLEAVRRFLRDEIKVFDGYKFSEIEGRRNPLEPNFIFHVNDLDTYAEVLQWYIDLNAGGVAHTAGEIEKVRSMLLKEQSK